MDPKETPRNRDSLSIQRPGIQRDRARKVVESPLSLERKETWGDRKPPLWGFLGVEKKKKEWREEVPSRFRAISRVSNWHENIYNVETREILGVERQNIGR